MKSLFNQTLIGCGALASLLLSASLVSCQDEDYGFTSEEISAAAYKRNFEAMYGEIAPNQTWDFSAYALHRNGLVGGPDQTNPETRAAQSGIERENNPVDLGTSPSAIGTIVGEKYVLDPLVDPTTKAPSSASNAIHDDVISEWLNEHMTERQNHSGLGDPFKLINDGGDFLIIPIYQGQSGMVWDLHLVDDRNNDYKIWHKSDGITFKEDYSLGKGEEFQYRQENANGNTVNFLDDSQRNGDIVVESPLKNAINGTTLTKDVKITFELPVYYDFSQDQYRKWNWIKGTLQYGSNKSEDVSLQYKGDGQEGANNKLSQTITIPNGTNVENLKFVMDKENSYNSSVHTYSANHVRIFVNYEYQSDTKNLHNYPNDIRNGENSISYFQGHTIFKHHVEAEAIRINSEKLGKDHSFYLYLDVVYSDNNNKDYALPDSKQRSDRDMMRALTDFSSFSGESPINEKYLLKYVNEALGLNLTSSEYLVVGCEDANGSEGDWDYNDVVLLIAGLPKRPSVATNVVEKRYMIEDLGSTFDFDFNDIVVDVKQAKIGSETKQTATITHLCGTIPYQLFIDDTPFTPVMKGQNGSDHNGFDPQGEDFVFPISGWDPDKNNISILVWPDKTYESFDDQYKTGHTKPSVNGNQSTIQYNVDTKGARQIKFPNAGDLPYIIAFDPEVRWRDEHESVPRAWFTTQSIIDAWNQNTIDKTEVEKAVDEAINAKIADGWLVVDPSNSRYFNNANTTGTHNTNATNASINLTNFLIDKKYIGGNIELAMLLPQDAPDYSEVKGSFTCAESAGEISDDYVHFNDFEISDGALFKSFEMKTSELLKLACRKSSDLKYNITYSTFGFTAPQNAADANAYTRVLLKFNKLTSDINTSEFGTKYDYVSSSVTKNNQNTDVNLKPFFIGYNGTDDILVTIVNPSGTNINGKICRGGENQSDMINANAGSTGQCLITNSIYKEAINNSESLYFESYGGRDMFDPDLICGAQIYIKTQTPIDVSAYGTELTSYTIDQIMKTENGEEKFDFYRLNLLYVFNGEYGGGTIKLTLYNPSSSKVQIQVKPRSNSDGTGWMDGGSGFDPIELNKFNENNGITTITINETTNPNFATALKSGGTIIIAILKENSQHPFETNTSSPVRVFADFNKEIIENSNCEGSSSDNYRVKENNGGISNATITANVGNNNSSGIKITSNSGASQDYDTQFFIVLDESVKPSGKKLVVKFDYKADRSVNNIDTQWHSDPGTYKSSDCVGQVNFTTNWQSFKKEITISDAMVNGGYKTIAFNLSKDRSNQVNFYFDNISVYYVDVE